MMNRKPGIFSILFFSCFSVFAQDESGSKGTFYIAPDFGLMLGTVNRIEISPALGYCITDRLSIAGGFKYEFYSETRLYASQYPVKTSIFGPRAFARYTVFENIGDYLPIGINTALFGHAEFESSSLENKYFSNSISPGNGRFWYSTVLLGGGISQAASERINLTILLLWDADPGSVSFYSNPVIRFGLQFMLKPRY
jgi:hypothetical protein